MLLGFWDPWAFVSLDLMEKNTGSEMNECRFSHTLNLHKLAQFSLIIRTSPFPRLFPDNNPQKAHNLKREISFLPRVGKKSVYPCMFIFWMKNCEREVSYFASSWSSSVNWFMGLK